MPSGDPKAELRRTLLAARRALGPAARAHGDAARTSALLAAPEITRAEHVTGYVSVGTEPDPSHLLAALRGAGRTVLLPRLRPDGGLDLVVDDGTRVAGLRGTVEPTGPAWSGTPDVWLVPALAADRHGVRLGRGGGAYDRVLPSGATAVALLHDGELVDALPADPWDRPVSHAALPGGVVRLGGADVG